MDFSEVYRFSGPQPVFSPNGRFLAAAAEYRLVIRSTETLQVVQLFSCLDKIQDMQWCPSSLHVLCTLSKRSTIQVWSVRDPQFALKIEEGPAGVQKALWAPDGQNILIVADFQIRLTVWSLVDSACTVLRGPKFHDKGIAFSEDGAMAVVLERSQCKDHITFYSCLDWQPRSRATLPTSDAADLAWSPDGTCIAVWESALEYRVLVYAVDGSCLADYSAYSNALGIKTVAWSPTGQMLAVGSYDQKVRVLDYATWTPMAELQHNNVVNSPEELVVYQEVQERSAPVSDGRAASAPSSRSRYVLSELPLHLTPEKPPPLEKPNPKIGIGRLLWSADGQFLVTRSDSLPNLAWIWDATRLELASVIQQAASIRGLQWAPSGASLALTTSGPRVYLWSGDGASCVHIPLPAFSAGLVRWRPGGGVLLLGDKDSFCCAYLGSGLATQGQT